MNGLIAFAVALTFSLVASAAHADYLQIRRNALLKRGPERHAHTVEELSAGALVALSKDAQQNGYYKVKTRQGKRGYIYRSVVRRHPGKLPPAVPPPEPDDDAAEGPEPDRPVGPRPGDHLDPDSFEPRGTGGVPAMRAHFINVGQGAATLFEFSCGAVLVDTGGESNGEFNSGEALTGYLEAFFGRRADLNRTIDLLVITHPHLDHVLNAQDVVDHFSIKNVVTNGMTTGSGRHQQGQLEQWAHQNAKLDTVQESEVTAGGISNAVIDPLRCRDEDPRLRVFWGVLTEQPEGWTKKAFENENNNSVAVRVDFGKASFFITGDLELEGSKLLLKKHGAAVLDIDVWQVSHHGSKNGVSEEFLNALTPIIAVLGTGAPDREVQWSAWQYGHPRKDAIDLLVAEITRKRATVEVPVALATKTFQSVELKDAIYATGWDGTVVVTAKNDGTYRVLTER